MVTPDEQIGANLQRLRGDTVTQSDLASRMRERGWKWSQSTVWSVEKGERPLRLAEAEDVVDIFGLDGIHELTVSPVLTIVWAGTSAVEEAASGVRGAVSRLYDAKLRLVSAIDELEAGGQTFPELDLIDQVLTIDPHELVDLAHPGDGMLYAHKTMRFVGARTRRLLEVFEADRPGSEVVPRTIEDVHGQRDEYQLNDYRYRPDEEFNQLVRSVFEDA